MKLKLFMKDVRDIEFDVDFVAIGCIDSLIEEGYIDIPPHQIEDLVEEIKHELDHVINSKDRQLYAVKKNLLHSQLIVTKWHKGQEYYEYPFNSVSLYTIGAEEESGTFVLGELQAMPIFEGLPRGTAEYSIAVSRRFRAEATLYTYLEPILYEYVVEFAHDNYDTDQRDRLLSATLRDWIVEVADRFVIEAMQKSKLLFTLTTP